MGQNILTTFSFLFFVFSVNSQSTDTTLPSWTTVNNKKDFSVLVGYNQGKYGFADIGLAINHYGTNRHPFSLDYFISNEIKLNKDVIIGPKAGVWVGGGFAMGINFIYYTDFDKSSFVFRPEIGIGIEKAKLLYGYNWLWTKSLTGINQHQVGLTYCFTLKRLKSVEKRATKNATRLIYKYKNERVKISLLESNNPEPRVNRYAFMLRLIVVKSAFIIFFIQTISISFTKTINQ